MRDDRDDHARPFVVWLSGFSRETNVVKLLGNPKLPLIIMSQTARLTAALSTAAQSVRHREFEQSIFFCLPG